MDGLAGAIDDYRDQSALDAPRLTLSGMDWLLVLLSTLAVLLVLVSSSG